MLQILWSKSRNLFFVTIIDIVMSYKTHCKVSLWHILVLLRLLIKSANITLWYYTNAFGSVTSLWTTMSVCRSYCLPAVCLYVCLSVSRYVCLSVGLSKKKSKFLNVWTSGKCRLRLLLLKDPLNCQQKEYFDSKKTDAP